MLQILVVKARLLRGVWVHALAVLLSSALGGALAFQRIRGPATGSKTAVTPAARPGAALSVDAAATLAATLNDLDCDGCRWGPCG